MFSKPWEGCSIQNTRQAVAGASARLVLAGSGPCSAAGQSVRLGRECRRGPLGFGSGSRRQRPPPANLSVGAEGENHRSRSWGHGRPFSAYSFWRPEAGQRRQRPGALVGSDCRVTTEPWQRMTFAAGTQPTKWPQRWRF